MEFQHSRKAFKFRTLQGKQFFFGGQFQVGTLPKFQDIFTTENTENTEKIKHFPNSRSPKTYGKRKMLEFQHSRKAFKFRILQGKQFFFGGQFQVGTLPKFQDIFTTENTENTEKIKHFPNSRSPKTYSKVHI